MVQRSRLDTFWKGFEVRVKVRPSSRKKSVLESGSFCSFFFILDKCQLDLFVATTSFSRVTLTLALSARHLAYAFPLSPSPLPRLHMHKPMSTALVLAFQSDVFSFCLSFRRTRTQERLCRVPGLSSGAFSKVPIHVLQVALLQLCLC